MKERGSDHTLLRGGVGEMLRGWTAGRTQVMFRAFNTPVDARGARLCHHAAGPCDGVAGQVLACVRARVDVLRHLAARVRRPCVMQPPARAAHSRTKGHVLCTGYHGGTFPSVCTLSGSHSPYVTLMGGVRVIF
ncbi:hypothetical protein E2C01_095930 [Portunus trituberculatus]|uniref:Uncharacterized protein n=1 Tax=Portunus trituberculatus TaxID=210409 RepID=A0A5B7K1P6_PORTR|nr:hypothetical protein [Portunus trituberculatus]